MKRLFLATILFLFPFNAQAGFPEGENGYDLKKIENHSAPLTWEYNRNGNWLKFYPDKKSPIKNNHK